MACAHSHHLLVLETAAGRHDVPGQPQALTDIARESLLASTRIYPAVHKTRLLHSKWLSDLGQCQAYLKLENEQVCACFLSDTLCVACVPSRADMLDICAGHRLVQGPRRYTQGLQQPLPCVPCLLARVVGMTCLAWPQVLSLTPEAVARGLVTSSSGNHALAFLHACSLLPQQEGCGWLICRTFLTCSE